MSTDLSLLCRNITELNSSINVSTVIQGDCDPDERLWYIFFLSSVFSFIGAFWLVLCGRCITSIYKRLHGRSHSQQKVTDQQKNLLNTRYGDIGCVTVAKDWAGELISGQTNSGRILVS